MRKIMISSAVALLCAAALPATAAQARDLVAQDQANPQTDQATQQPRARDSGRRYCVREAMSNSRLARRVCYTQAQWDEMRRSGEASDDR